MDALTAVSIGDRDDPDTMKIHMAEILAHQGFEVDDQDIVLGEDLTRATAWMEVNGKMQKVEV